MKRQSRKFPALHNLHVSPRINIMNSWTRFLHPMIDIVIHADGKTFPANKSVLCQHSGYFRAVLSPDTTSLILPTVPADYFALLLSAMASNNLDINDSNVYQLLLYGQLLQMPLVILQCKAYIANLTLNSYGAASSTFLAPSTSGRAVSSTIVRPIPNKINQQPPPAAVAAAPALWKPWLYSASFYQDWISKLSLASSAHSASSSSSVTATNLSTFEPAEKSELLPTLPTQVN